MSTLEQVADAVRRQLCAEEKRNANEQAMEIVRRFADEGSATITGTGHLPRATIELLERVHVTVENTSRAECNCDRRESCLVCEKPMKRWEAHMILRPTVPASNWQID